MNKVIAITIVVNPSNEKRFPLVLLVLSLNTAKLNIKNTPPAIRKEYRTCCSNALDTHWAYVSGGEPIPAKIEYNNHGLKSKSPLKTKCFFSFAFCGNVVGAKYPGKLSTLKKHL